jgi:hypothetical protein
MARIDDYQQARDLAARELSQQSLDDIAGRSGLSLHGGTVLEVSFLARTYHIEHQDFSFHDPDDPQAQVPLQEQVLILHYLQGCRPDLKNQWIAYREIPGAGFYFGAFAKRALEPLKKVFGSNVQGLATAASQLGAQALDTGDAGFQFSPLPYTPVQLIVWQGDDEFPAEANILFDATVGDYLSPEDAAWLASLVVYRLIGLAKK